MKMKLLTALLPLLCSVSNLFAGDSLPVIISGTINNSVQDTVQLIYFHSQLEKWSTQPAQNFITGKNGRFHFKVMQSQNESGWMVLNVKHTGSENFYLMDAGCPVEGGDSIYTETGSTGNRYSAVFSGRNAFKYNAYNAMKRAVREFGSLLEKRLGLEDDRTTKIADSGRVSEFCLSSDSVLHHNPFLEKYRSILSQPVYDILYTEVAGTIRQNMIWHIADMFSQAYTKKDYRLHRQATQLFDRECKIVYSSGYDAETLPDEYMGYLFFYFSIKLYYMEKRDSLYSKFSLMDIYSAVKNSYAGPAKNYVLASFIKADPGNLKSGDGNTTDSLWRDLGQTINPGGLKNYITSRLDHMSHGLNVMDFSMPSPDGSMTTLSSFKGKVVLIDVWFTGCGGCLGYGANLEKSIYPFFKDTRDLVFVSICGDRNRQTWLASIQKGGYTRKENANVYTGGMGFDHPFLKYYNFNGGPYSLLIGRDGKIADGSPPKNNMEDLKRLLSETLAH